LLVILWAYFDRPLVVTEPLPLGRQMAAGALSGSVTMLCTFPLDLLRTRMSAEVTQAGVPRKYGSMPAAAVSTQANHQ
jgi:hypothetical protein